MTGQLRRRATAARRRLADGVEAGAAAVYAVILIPILLVFAAFAVDVAAWYVEIQRAQKTVDAASLAAAPFMPQTIDPLNPTDPASLAALDLIARNGYDLSAATASAKVEEGERTSQVRVTLSSTINNGLAGLAGIPTTTITRTAVADFTAPAPMGSPCNTMGNEPAASSPPTSAVPPSPLATCPPGLPANFWANIQGPETSKLQGDRFMTRRCSTTATDNCVSQPGPNNQDFRARGYYHIVRVSPAVVASGQSVTVQLYDPVWINKGNRCQDLPGGTDGMNPYAPDGATRYASSGTSGFCSGDYDPRTGGDGSGSAGRVDTSFALLGPNELLDPTQSTVISGNRSNDPTGTDTGPCIKQFRGYSASERPDQDALTATADTYNENIARVLHQWVTLCTFTPTEAGDYYMQFRTNVTLGGTPSTNTNDLDPGIFIGNSAVVGQADDASEAQRGRGSNAFAVRAFVGTPSSPQLGAGTEVSVSGYERFPMFQNAPGGGAAQPFFNLIRVLPGAAGQNIRFTYFDVADAQSSGTVSVFPPLDVDPDSGLVPTSPASCSASGVVNGDFSTCSVTISSDNNGRIQELRVPVPEEYDCDFSSPGGCWWRLQVNFGAGTVNDITTWTATIDGDPVRLIE